MKVLNLYAGIGGNRKLWGEEHDITAVEIDENIANVYADLFPNDEVVIGDAHQYLIEHHKEFDFIWASPPCQSHSSFRQNIGVRYRGVQPVYPDMKLYQEILFLQHNFDGHYVVENVKPYYQPLIGPNFKLDRHLFWSNFQVQEKEFDRPRIRSAQIPQLQEFLGYDLSGYKLPNKRQILRNCVQPRVGKYILDSIPNKEHIHI
ncbi:DNA cytosine methyltransferase [Gracilibacillus dipsosauri]|uniref:DNA cytosine methyltransferase n=1 Tax=Gracilibacillus dipsosauri TaxID=178340 RepID=A0A317KTG0_9BACI|nr:DNA cytosine methyltransferase [Gracilibacillus dipsosauri]PWU66563.1 DNA cytosine methyltransferase [Gracilibacillus dipsosauri]